MFIVIPGRVISLFTFPGIIVHEIAHKFFCDILNIPVYQVCYFQNSDPVGYVIHEQPKNIRDAFLISFAPLIVNSILCVLTTFPVVCFLSLKSLGWLYYSYDLIPAIQIIAAWVGISIGMHSLPSKQDIKIFLTFIKQLPRATFASVFLKLFAMLFQGIQMLRFFWIDLFYAIIISVIAPAVFMCFISNA
ncbi:metalloprotease family protein [Rickettsia endosymbiont of Cardiosporidium cionae]|uniref:metalloprotease family protein n=1 Tax=Rickettsia endosymbiont of Cardiosporidium cionae TaxID=2777155 RepID=UPI00189352A8|nr:metalloprotease family protein [Rickettsia endosymbiont of Cardiosporidium cionae]KAF8818776.1 hypothetical protein IHI24_000010 [Rickettsia endosymbiont of Cardiosporidium cionae]